MKIYDKKELNEYYQSLTYDDISLVPTEISRIKSRKETATSAEFLQEKLQQPVISSPMESVTGLDMAKELTSLGCLGILNRFDSSLKRILEDDSNGKFVLIQQMQIITKYCTRRKRLKKDLM
jgi:IMP dehydrogenase